EPDRHVPLHDREVADPDLLPGGGPGGGKDHGEERGAQEPGAAGPARQVPYVAVHGQIHPIKRDRMPARGVLSLPVERYSMLAFAMRQDSTTLRAEMSAGRTQPESRTSCSWLSIRSVRAPSTRSEPSGSTPTTRTVSSAVNRSRRVATPRSRDSPVLVDRTPRSTTRPRPVRSPRSPTSSEARRLRSSSAVFARSADATVYSSISTVIRSPGWKCLRSLVQERITRGASGRPASSPVWARAGAAPARAMAATAAART